MRYDPSGDDKFQLERILSKGVNFVEHMDGGFLEVTSTGALQEIRHGLGRVPIGFIVIYKSQECDIWGQNLASWTKESLFLRSSVSSVELRLFVM